MNNLDHEQTTENKALSDTMSVLAQLYVEKRLERRYNDYKSNIRDFDKYSGDASTITVIIMMIVALLSTLGVVLTNSSTIAPTLTCLNIILSSFVFYLMTMRGIYQWNRNRNIYQRSRISLEDARMKIPETHSLNEEKVEYAIAELVTTAEDVIARELSERLTRELSNKTRSEESKENKYVPEDLKLVSHLIVKEGTVRTTAFISYRRKGSWLHARKLHADLSLIGVDAFMDFEDLTEGDFEENLHRELHEREHLIAILVPGTLDSEWVKIEIITAMKLGKNIVPILADGFMFPPVMPEGLENFSKQNAVTLSQEYYGASMAKLARFLQLE